MFAHFDRTVAIAQDEIRVYMHIYIILLKNGQAVNRDQEKEEREAHELNIRATTYTHVRLMCIVTLHLYT